MAKRAKTIDLLRVVALLQEHITPALCRTVFGAVRTTERQRVWTLEALIRFWTAVVLRAPKALTQALVDSLEGRDPTYPRIEASPEAFFQRCRDLRPAFFAEVFQRFTARLVTAVPPRYAAEVAPVRARFTAIVILDGSRLAAIAHRLKLLWNERAVVLPGCLLGVYDLGRGLCRQLTFCADAAASEMTRAKAAVAALGRDTLVLGDRLYGPADFFAALGHQHCWGVVRRNRQLSLHKLQRLRKRRIHSGVLEDWLVRAGTGATAPRQLRRYIRWRRGGTRYEVLTNVLAPARLSAEEALDLYPYRWSVERMFFDLKEVLNLNRLYAANPNAVAMQVYASPRPRTSTCIGNSGNARFGRGTAICIFVSSPAARRVRGFIDGPRARPAGQSWGPRPGARGLRTPRGLAWQVAQGWRDRDRRGKGRSSFLRSCASRRRRSRPAPCATSSSLARTRASSSSRGSSASRCAGPSTATPSHA